MKPFLALLAAVSLALPSSAQRVVVNPDGQRFVERPTSQTSRTDRLINEFIPFDEYFGADGAVLETAHGISDANSVEDRFRWEEKIPFFGSLDNSCYDAAENMYNSLEPVLPEGWTVRMLGELGELTNAENTLFNTWGESMDVLDPPSYSHTLSVLRSPDGAYYTIDNWAGDTVIKRVYPIDADGVFFSTDPDETNIQNAMYRQQRNRYGTDPNNERDRKERTRSPLPPTSEETPVEVLTSADPNDKMGLVGAGEARYVSSGERLDYVIRFENMPTASAPAQEVLVRDTLDTAVFDLSTFELNDIHFSGRRVPVAPGRAQFFARVPLGTDDRLEVLVDANLVVETGIVTWRFTTIERSTNDLPDDPLDGFLPPNGTSPEGEGSVTFHVRARPDLPEGTTVSNLARIIFDLNEPIDTPPWVNSFDDAPPTSRVTALAPTQPDSVFTVAWTGEDGGSGVRTYDVHVSVNGRPFRQWLRRATGTREAFVGNADSTYAFYSIAYDAVGNAEPPKTQGEASTGVVVSSGGGPTLPPELALAAPFPNPVASAESLTLSIGLPAPGRIDLRVFDLRGRELATLSDAEVPAGWHMVRWDLRGLASGVYVVRLRADGEARTRRVTVVR